MKVINVLNGYLKQYAIEQITIIKGHKVLCSVSVNDFLTAYRSKIDQYPNDLAKEYAEMEVVDRDILNNNKLFLFVS